MSGIYVRKVQKIGGQVVINIPKAICEQIGIKKGDLVAYTEVGEDSAVMVKAKFDRITELRRQEMLNYGEGKKPAGTGEGIGSGGSDAGRGGERGAGGGNKGAEGGDSGERGISDKRNDAGDSGATGGPENDAGAEGGDNGSDDNTSD